MFAKLTNGTIDQYPYTVGDLRRDNPNVSFPRNIPGETMLEYGMRPVQKETRPPKDPTKNVVEGTPVLVDNAWTQVWNVTDATLKQIEERKVRERASMRCSLMQGILTLGETEWGKVLEYRDTTATWAEKIIIDSSLDWRRNSENIAFFQYLLNYTDDQVDDLFRTAMQVEA